MDFGPEIDSYRGKRIGMYGGKFLPLHRGHVSFIQRAQAMVDVLFIIVHHDEPFERALCEGTRFTWVPPHLRERWLAEEFKAFPNVRVVSAYEHRSADYMQDDSIFDAYAELQARIGHIDVVFSGEDGYGEYFAKYLPEAEVVTFYQDRPVVSISATQIREMGVYAAWDYLPRPVQNTYVKRVALCGVESVGKTFMSNALATALDTVTVPEYGRLYYEELHAYTEVVQEADFTDIAAGQLHTLNRGQRSANKILIADTDLIYSQFFFQQAYGRRSEVLETLLRSRAERIDRYIYIEPRNAHALDGTRLPVDEGQRHANNLLLKSLYAEYGAELVVVDETDNRRRFERVLAAAREVLD